MYGLRTSLVDQRTAYFEVEVCQVYAMHEPEGSALAFENNAAELWAGTVTVRGSPVVSLLGLPPLFRIVLEAA